MKNISERQLKIVNFIKNHPNSSFKVIFEYLEIEISERTIKRELTSLVEAGFLITEGGGRSLTYSVPLSGRFFLPCDNEKYAVDNPDERQGVLQSYQAEVWQVWPQGLFSDIEYGLLQDNTSKYAESVRAQSDDVRGRELERFVIELSWKSSRIEGNTYTLLDTERLIKEGVPSKSNTEEETIMILNHKSAFDFIITNPIADGSQLTMSYVEHVQQLLMQGLLHDIGLRKHGVGITGSNYHPLDNQFQINEAFDELLICINQQENVFDQALTCLLGTSYIQPFVDGNKRTARLVANALLLSGSAAPLSYRNVDEVNYRSALLGFYEQLSIVSMKDLFIDQYIFATEHYS